MRQYLADQPVLKMPYVMHKDMICFETARQLRADSLDALSYIFAKFEKRFRKLGIHILSLGRDDKNSVTLKQEAFSELINEAFVRSRNSLKFFQQRFKALNVIRTRRQQGIMCNYAEPRDAQAKFESVIMHVFCGATHEISLSGVTASGMPRIRTVFRSLNGHL